MQNRFVQEFFISAGEFLIPLDLLFIIGVAYFIKLPKEMRVDIHYWLPFFILLFTMFYENLGAYTNYNYDFKKAVNTYLGNIEYPKFNLWVNNITKREVGVILYLFLIKSWVEPAKKKFINWIIYIFVIVSCLIQFSGLEPLYFNQPIIFATGANLILVGCSFYFIGLITNDQYIDSNLLRLLSFWQITFIMFTFTLTYISRVSLLYLYEVDPVLGKSLSNIEWILQLVMMAILTLTIASPFLSGIFEKEPSYEFS